MSRPNLIIMCGLPASGKSTKAREIVYSSYEKYTIISSDEIRKEICGDVADQSKNAEVFDLFHKRTRELLKAGENVILDATNITMKSRRAILENVKNIDCKKICVVMATKYQNCIANNIARPHAVPMDVLWGMMKRFQVPFYEEGFDSIEFIQDSECSMDESDARNIMKNYDQSNPHHSDKLEVHCSKVASNIRDYYYFRSISMAGFLHDIGKPLTRSVDDEGVAHYYSHANVGAYLVMSNPEMINDKWYLVPVEIFAKWIFLINYHMEPFNWTKDNSQKMKKRFGEDNYEMLLEFNKADKSR